MAFQYTDWEVVMQVLPRFTRARVGSRLNAAGSSGTTGPVGLLAVLGLAAVVLSCESSPASGAPGDARTIAIECSGNPLPTGEDGVQVVQVDVGDSIRCSIELSDLPAETEDGLRQRPAQYEWAFSSTDGGSVYPSDSKGILWDVSEFYRSFIEYDPECSAARSDGDATARALKACSTVCCEIGSSDFELMQQGECNDRGGSEAELWRCPGKAPLQPVCCELPIEYPDGTANPDFVTGYRQITTQNTCANYCECTAACTTAPVVTCGEPLLSYGPGGPDPTDFTSKCRCCRLPDGSIRSADGECVDGFGGEVIDWEECWDDPDPCGADDHCDLTFCEALDGDVDIQREDVCASDDGAALGRAHDGSVLVCCEDDDDGELFPISVLGSTRGVHAETEEWFEAISEGTVTVRMRQLIAPPILFDEEYPGSSLVYIRVGPVMGCRPDFDISGTFSERYNCSEGPNCVDEDFRTDITIMPGSGTGEYTFSSGSWYGSGTLCGSQFDWTATGPDYSERGTWFFSDESNFTKTSSYTYFSGGGGSCTGTASEDGSPPPPAPIGGCR